VDEETSKASPLKQGQTNRLLGYPVDARLLIMNADDFDMACFVPLWENGATDCALCCLVLQCPA
jgi:hypothetical protein